MESPGPGSPRPRTGQGRAQGTPTSQVSDAINAKRTALAAQQSSSYDSVVDLPRSAAARTVVPWAYVMTAIALLLIFLQRLPGLSRGGLSGGHSDDLVFEEIIRRQIRHELVDIEENLNATQVRFDTDKAVMEDMEEQLQALQERQVELWQRLHETSTGVESLLEPTSSSVDLEHLKSAVRSAIVEVDDVHAAAQRYQRNRQRDAVDELRDNLADPDALPVAEWVQLAVAKHLTQKEDRNVLTKAAANDIIKHYLADHSDAECSGQHDFASAQNGGKVVAGRTSKGMRSLFFSYPTARVAITPGTEYGQCWPLQAPSGVLTVQLANTIRVRAVSIMHLHPRMAKDGYVKDAPRDFEVYGHRVQASKGKLGALGSPLLLGKGTYDSSLGCATIAVGQGVEDALAFVTLNITSNHGHANSCLYRFMVHGDVAS